MAQKSLVLPVATANYVSVFKPKLPPNAKPEDEKNYSVTLTYDKKNGAKVLTDLRKVAVEVANAKWPGKGEEIIKGMKWPVISDGDVRLSPASGEPMFPGRLFVVAKRKESFGPPGVIDKHGQRIMDPSLVYAGAQVRVQVNLFPFSHPLGGRGVGVGLSNLMLVADGERLDGRQEAEEAFADFVEEPATTDENPDSML